MSEDTDTVVTTLDHVRRMGRLIFGSQARADAHIRTAFPSDELHSLANSMHFTEVQDALGVYSAELTHDISYEWAGSAYTSLSEEEAQDELDGLTVFEREVFVMHYVEGDDVETVATLLRSTGLEVWNAAARVMRHLSRNERRVLFIDSHSTDVRHVTTLRLMSEVMLDHVDGFDKAIELLSRQRYWLVVGAPDDASQVQIARIVDRLHASETRALWIKGSLARVSSELMATGQVVGGAIVGDAFVESVRDALYVEPHRWMPPLQTFSFEADGVDEQALDEALMPVTAPIDAVVEEDQLRLAPSVAPASAVPFEALDGLRQHHRREALALADEMRSGNAAARVLRRLDAAAEILGQALTEQMVLAIGVATDALARLLPTMQEELMPLDAADIAVFVEDLQRFANQFPAYRQFNLEASANRPITKAEDAALSTLAGVVAAQSDKLVAPPVKRQLELIATVRAQQADSSIADMSWVWSVSNVMKAVGRHAKMFGAELLSDAGKKTTSLMGTLITALLATKALEVLGTHLPIEFAAAALVLKRADKQIKKSLEAEDEDH